MITQAELDQIIATMGPIMKLHPSELYKPDDVDAYFQDAPSHVSLKWGRVPSDDSYDDFESEGVLTCVAVGSDGAIWGVDGKQNIYRRDGSSWTQIPGHLVQISVGNAGQVWGVDANDLIYRRDGNSWTNIPGHLTNVAVGTDGTVWGVDRAGAVYRRDANSWTTIPGTLMQISVGSAAQVWGVNKDGLIFRRDGSSWTNIPGRLVTISVASDGTVWGVDKDFILYRRDGAQWTQQPGTWYQVSAGSATQVWATGASNLLRVTPPRGPAGALLKTNVYNLLRNYRSRAVSSGDSLMTSLSAARSDPEHADPAFHCWQEISPGFISGNSSRAKAYVTVSHFNPEVVRIAFWFYYPFNGPGKFRVSVGSAEQHIEVPTVGRHYSDWEHVTLAVRKTSQGWTLDAVYLSRHDLTVWLPPSSFQFVGQHPVIYVARDSHANYESPGFHYYKRPWSMDFGLGTAAVDLYDMTADNGDQIDTSQPARHVLVQAQADLTALSAVCPVWFDYDGRWGQYERLSYSYTIGMGGDLSYTYTQTEVGAGPVGPAQHDSDEFWRTVPGTLNWVSVGSDGAVWGVGPGNLIYRRDGSSWTTIPGHLVQISVGSASQVWGVDADDLIYRRDGNSWTNIPGHLVNVAVGADGTVWGVDRGGLIYRRDGNSWTNIPGQLAMIAVGNSRNVWGAGRDGSVYRWDANSWVKIPGALNTLSVASDGAVWGLARPGASLTPVTMDGLIYRRDASSWTQISGGLRQISVGSSSLVWGVDMQGRIYQRS